MGQVYTAGGGQNPARQAAKAAGKLTYFCLPHLRGHLHQKTQLPLMTRLVHLATEHSVSNYKCDPPNTLMEVVLIILPHARHARLTCPW